MGEALELSRTVNGRRAVVTGLGPVTPLGTGVQPFWDSLLAGLSGIGAIGAFDTTDFPIGIAAEVRDFDPEEYMPAARARWLDRFSQLACAAARMAVADAGLALDTVAPHRIGVVVGTGIGGLLGFEQVHESLATRGPRGVSPAFIGRAIPNAAAGAVAIDLGLTGPSECTATACASSAHALVRATELVRQDVVDIVLAGGVEAAVTRLVLAAFHAVGALSTRNGDPQAASRPFDRGRDGFVCGEGAVVAVIEELGHARSRGAAAYGEILGYGLSSDAFHPIAPEPEGRGAGAAMQAALRSAEIDPSDVDHINAHATSTPAGDLAEARAIRRVFGDRCPPVSATKSMTGHLIGAAGAAEAAATLLAIRHDTVPPTMNLEHLDPECEIDVVAGAPRTTTVDVALSNSFAFGGHNVSLAFGKAGDDGAGVAGSTRSGTRTEVEKWQS